LSVTRPSLEDVYLELTAEPEAEPEAAGAGAPRRRGRR
ncbi:MAG: ABC transporter, partial [Solirubrobacterales bacterium]|nr:ABC transporter [Solirubrobacterales bacterium]